MSDTESETVRYFFANGSAIQDEVVGHIISAEPVEGSLNQIVLLRTPHDILTLVINGMEALSCEPYTGPDLDQLQKQYGVKREIYPAHDNHIDN
jgi:hypothetical protein